MTAVALSTAVDLSKIKVKWKEQYVSEALNHKTSSTLANGVYRGLQLTQNITSVRLVSVTVGSDPVHAAVLQSATGFSLTYFDVAGASITLDLSSPDLSNQETVIALSVTYIVGGNTTANWMAYPIADWNALSAAAQAELIVLGTVNVPLLFVNITTSMISMKRRSWAWENAAGSLVWSPLLKNGTFEHAELNATTDYSASYWRFGNLGTSGFQAQFKVQNTSARTGTNCLVVDHTVTGLQSTEAEQEIGAPVTPGQLIKYRFFLQRLKVAAGGNPFKFSLRFVGPDMVTETDINVNTTLNATDAGYLEISDTVAAPAGTAFLVSAYMDYTANMSSTGLALRIDDMQVWLQTSGAQSAVSEPRVQQFTHTGAVVLEDNDDPFVDFFGEAIMLRNKATELRIERRDFNRTTGSPVLISPTNGVIQKFGEDLINTTTRARIPRISVPAMAGASTTDMTLIQQVLPAGKPGHRLYMGQTGIVTETFNASYDGTNWNKDVAGTAAIKRRIVAGAYQIWYRLFSANTPWNDSSWTGQVVSHDADVPMSTFFLPATFQLAVTMSTTLGVTGTATAGNFDVGGGVYRHTTRTLRWMTNNPCTSFLSGASPSNPSSESFGTGSTASGTWFCPLNPWNSFRRIVAARFFLPSTIVGTGGLVTLQERQGGSYVSISSDFTLTNGQNGIQSFAGITASTHSFPIGIRMNLQTGSTTTALISYAEIDYDVI